MNTIISIVFITVLSTMTSYAMNFPEMNYYLPETIEYSPIINFANFTNFYVEYAFHISKTCSTPKEFLEQLLCYEDTPQNRKNMKTMLKNNQISKNILTNEEILTSILKKNNISDSKINETLQEYQQKLQNCCNQ